MAELLGEILGWPPVRGVVAVLDPERLVVKQRPPGVEVLEARKLVRWLKKRKEFLDPGQVAQIESIIRLRTTWQQGPETLMDLDWREEFEQLRRTVTHARRRRMAWVIGGLCVLVVGALLMLV
ncbi:hypothetical protein ACWEOO_25975 [Kribbella sp. NPDC004138]